MQNTINKNNGVNVTDSLRSATDKHEKLQCFMQDIQLSTLKYLSAIKEVETKIDILREDFCLRTGTSPIEHVSSRVKTPESIINKMIRNQVFTWDVKEMENNVLDIAGIRIICSFIDDIFKIEETLKKNTDFEIVKEKDYITYPKPSGYRSYHLIVKVPIHLTTGVEKVNVEIQIRTMAMDFWASLEHKIKYKYNGVISPNIAKELFECSKMAYEMDNKMMELQKEVLLSQNQ